MNLGDGKGNAVVLCIAKGPGTPAAVSNAMSRVYPKTFEIFAARTASQAEAAARTLAASNGRIAACIATCSLPKTDGASVLSFVQRSFPRAATALVAMDHERHMAVQAVKDEFADRVICESASDDEWDTHVAALIAHNERLEELHQDLAKYPGRHLFVTGATGFLGARFVRDVLRCTDVRITALTRERKGISHDRRLNFTEDDYPGRLQFLEGDVREANLGLSTDDREVLANSVDEVWHLAAMTTFDEVMRDATFAVNLDGTRNTLDFAGGLKNLTCFHHVSTSYVCGDRHYPEVATEKLHVRPDSFRNPYEESKFEAEGLVAASGLPYLMYRPSIILGETVSGRSDGQTVYNIAKMVRLAKLLADKDCADRELPADHHSFRVVADTESRKNLIPVDTVIAMMLRIRASRPEFGKIFHVTHPDAVRVNDLVEVIADLLDTKHYEIVDSLEGEELSVPEQALERVAQIFRPYMVSSDPVFDARNVNAALGDTHGISVITRDALQFSLDAFYTQYFGVDYKAVSIGA